LACEEDENELAETRTVRQTCGVELSDIVASIELTERLALDNIVAVLQLD